MQKKFLFVLGICLLFSFQTRAYSNSVVEVNTNNLLSIIANSKGKVIVLNFWASWCPYCKREIKELIQLRKKYSPHQLKILGVSMDTNVGSYTKILKKSKINYPCYLASDSSIGMVFNVFGIPSTIVYDREGRLVKQFSGYVEYRDIKELVDKLLHKSE